MYERTLRLRVYPRIGNRPLAAVRRSDIQALGPPKTTSSLRTVPAPAFVLEAQSLHRSLAAAVRTAGLKAGITFHQLRRATETLHTYSHLWPSGDDKTRQVLDVLDGRRDDRDRALPVVDSVDDAVGPASGDVPVFQRGPEALADTVGS